MTLRRFVLILLPTLGCHLLSPGHSVGDGGSSTDGGGTSPDLMSDSAPVTPPDLSDDGGAVDTETLPPFSGADGGEGSAQQLLSSATPADLAPAVASLVSRPGWGSDLDAGASTDAALPAPDPSGGMLALSRVAPTGEWRTGCGEPTLCYLRTAIITSTGRLYTSSLSSAYPNDTCARDIINDGKDILIGDSRGRFGQLMCARTSPEITVGFLLPNQILGTKADERWSADDGFRSQWTISEGVPADNGLYLPAPNASSTLDLLWLARYDKGEVYGSLVVPLRDSVTGAPATGALLFDVQIR